MVRYRKNELDDFGVEDSPYLRRQRTIEVRRSRFQGSTAKKVSLLTLSVLLLAGLGWITYASFLFLTTSPRFIIATCEISGCKNLSPSVVQGFIDPLKKQNIFRANFQETLQQLQEIPWVKSATIARHLPNRISVTIVEREPVGLARIQNALHLVDRDAVWLAPMGEVHTGSFDFPILTGLVVPQNEEDRALNGVRVSRYLELVNDLDSEGGQYSKSLSEVDVSDPEDVKILLTDDPILIHLGHESYLERFKLYLGHIRELKSSQPAIDAVDLRFKNQIVVKKKEGTP